MPSKANPVRPYVQPPMVADLNLRQWLNWAHQSILQLQSAANPAPAVGGIGSLVPNAIDPTTAQILSKGARTASITTSIKFVASANSMALYWDGTNGSTQLTIYRDDGSQLGPTIVGSPQVISGLSPSTTYFIYPYWDDVHQKVSFATGGLVGVGTPPWAFTTPNLKAAQQTLLAGNIPLGLLMASTGIATPASGTNAPASGGTGGGGVGGATCFSGNTRLICEGRYRSFDELKPGNYVMTASRTWRPIRQVVMTAYEGPILNMGKGELVKPRHRFLVGGEWTEAKDIGLNWQEVPFKGIVYNLSVDTEDEDEQSYTLANGLVAHNFKLS